MPIAPEEIARKRFVVTLRGYDRSEVDAFMRTLAGEQTRLLNRIKELEAAATQASAPEPPGPSPAPSADEQLAALLSESAARLARRRRLRAG